MSKGEWLFRTRCAACHAIGDGDHIGPNLAGVTTARERSWLLRSIARPNEVLAEGDPVARGLHARYGGVNMPSLGLGDADVSSLLTFLEAKGRGVGPPGRTEWIRNGPVTPGRSRRRAVLPGRPVLKARQGDTKQGRPSTGR